MCDYSLHVVASRAAESADTLVSTEFAGTFTRGFAAPDNPRVAVCLLPGTEIAFEENVWTKGLFFGRSVGDRLARFRHINTDQLANMDQPAQHNDALEFSNGRIVMVTDLVPGQRAKVLQLPVDPGRCSGVADSDVREPAVAIL